MVKKLTILGSTGSIGRQALEVLDKIQFPFEVVGLSAGNNIELFRLQLKKYSPKYACVNSEEDFVLLMKEFPNIEFYFGEEGLKELAQKEENELVLVAVSGKIGLIPTLSAIEKGIDIALANKETLVMAGDIVIKKAKEKKVRIIPVDSEHSAIYQCIHTPENIKQVRKLIITASGGPFRNSSVEEMQNADVAKTLAHPKWNMGKKITVDSATLMNKGLEIIEAHHLFNVDYSMIDVIIHPQSVIHSAVEFLDGSVIAQMGVPSMHIPIQYALTCPKRVEGIKTDSLDLIKISRLDFEKPDFQKFPCLELAIEAGKKGGFYPVALNAANEEAVLAFLQNKLKLWHIPKIVNNILQNVEISNEPTLLEIIHYDNFIRQKVNEIIETL